MAGDFDRGEAAYKTVKNGHTNESHVKHFSTDPEQRFYEVMHWAKDNLRLSIKFHYDPAAERALEPEEMLLFGIRTVAKELQDPQFWRRPEEERTKWFAQKAEEVYKAIAAFVAADSLRARSRSRAAT
jgi:hypothetical protein